MKTLVHIVFLAALSFSAWGTSARCYRVEQEVSNAPRPTALMTEWRADPVGIDAPRPRLAWRMAAESEAKDQRQTAWQIQAASSEFALSDNRIDLWDSGKVVGAESFAEWGGPELVSSQRVWWRVRTFNADGRASNWSMPTRFVMGVLKPEDWRAKWIGPNALTRPDADFGNFQWLEGEKLVGRVRLEKAPAENEVISMVHIATRTHRIKVNGKDFHAPSGHVFNWRYARFRDITKFLHQGENVIEVALDKVMGHEELTKTPPKMAFIAVLRRGGVPFAGTDASWTGGKPVGTVRGAEWGRQAVLREEIASPAFAKKFYVRGQPLKSATLHITGLGFYEARLNGVKIGDKVLDPSPTAYDKRVLYSTYALEGALKPLAENELEILVGHGWYDVRSIATWNFDHAPWRDFPRTIAQLELEYTDGDRALIVTDGSWRQIASPVGYDCIREGEVYGARDRRMPNLQKPQMLAEVVPAPAGRLVAESQPGAKVVRTIAPKAIHPHGNGVYVVEFPEALAGWVRLDVHGARKGDVVSIRYDERVGKGFMPAVPSSDSRAGNHDLRGDGPERRRIDCHFRYTCSQEVCAKDAEFQCDRLVASGLPVERYEPRFTYNGFQYVVLKGLRQAPARRDVTACVVSTDFPDIGKFECSDSTFNTLMSMAKRSYRSNFADGVPTDCPHREKNGWMGDASFASVLGQYIVENTAGYEKFLRDIGDAQRPNGDLPGIVPSGGWGFKWGNGPAWDSALPVIAWHLWAYRGDRRALDLAYPALKRIIAYTATKANADGLVGHGLGDWIPVEREHMPKVEFTSSCFYLQAQLIAARIAAVKGLEADRVQFAAGAEKTLAGLRKAYYHGDGVWDNGRQTAQAFALAYGLASDAKVRELTARRLVKAVEETNCHVDVGLLGMMQLFRQLGEIGRFDLAYRMLVQPTWPSPVEWIKKNGPGSGLWEDWRDGASRNHAMFSDFAACAYQYLAGIRLPEGGLVSVPEPERRAFSEFLFNPQFVPGLDWVKASVDLPAGMIAAEWRREGEVVKVQLVVPSNSRALVRLPGIEKTVGSGKHEFSVRPL